MSLSIQSLQSALAPLVAQQVRSTTGEDSVAGMMPSVVVEPENEEEVAAVLAFADREGLRVLVRGGGTQLGMGAPPREGHILLSTKRMNAVLEHVPHDLVVTVQAGLPLQELQATLQQSNQWLALDPDIAPEATIGGIVSTNVSGPRRLRYGGIRDQIIGIRVVLADGTIAKGGGKVVKNVAGYDLPKLFTGALGTLGIIVSVTFRLYPLPVASCTVEVASSRLTPLSELAVRMLDSTLVPTIIDIAGDTTQANSYTMAVRFEMGQEAVEAQATTLLSMIDESHNEAIQSSRMLRGDDETQFWSLFSSGMSSMSKAKDTPDIADTVNTSSTTLSLKASLLPTEVAQWLGAMEEVCRQPLQTLRATWRAHAGHGLVHVQLSGEGAKLVEAVQQLRTKALQLRGTLIVTDAPTHIASQLDIWGPVPALAVMRNLKVRFDPNSTLNPGRFVGGL